MKVALFLLGLLSLVIQGHSVPKSTLSFAEAAVFTNLPDVVLGQFPWQAFLYDNDKYVGSGSIISDSWVLTIAANCRRHNAFTLKFGTIKRVDADAVTMVSSDLRLHPEYDYDTAVYVNDICLIKLPSALEFTNTVAAIKLIPPGQSYNTFIDQIGRISGFGHKDYISWGEVKVVEQDECLGLVRDRTVKKGFCVKGNENMPYDIFCNTDMGVPLVIKGDDGVWMQIGIKTVYIFDRCWKDTYTLYHDLSPFLDFINDTIAENN